MDDGKNIIMAIVLSAAVLILYQILVVAPEADRREALEQARDLTAEETLAAGLPDPAAATAPPDVKVSREAALAKGPGRIAIDTPSLAGSINLMGGRLDDLHLKNYREEIDPESERITLLSPVGAQEAYLAFQGWTSTTTGIGDLPGPSTVWSAPAGARLTPETPVTLTYESADGLTFERTISVDDQFMFSIAERVRSARGEDAVLYPYGVIQQFGRPSDLENFMILHEGPLGVFGEELKERKYDKVVKSGGLEGQGEGGWIGITGHYWLTALIPPQDETFEGEFKNVGAPDKPVFQSNYTLSPRTLAPGDETVLTTQIFAGAKKVKLIRDYQREFGIHALDRSVDWGRLFFLTRPIFMTLNFFGHLTGNYGLAILLLTLCIKIIFFPLANQSYAAMSKMKKLQPKMTEMRERYKDDRMKMQQEMMELYKREKLNPLAGCLPVLVQIPVFFALYKVLFVTIELRHAPFFGWIQDLSAPDPTSLFNLFGLLPYDPSAVPVIGTFLAIGVWPLLMGVAMWFQTKLNPPPADPVQQQIFALMPIFFTILLAGFASGLVIYWWWNTALSIAQQWVIMKRMGVDTNLGDSLKPPAFITKLFGGASDASSK